MKTISLNVILSLCILSVLFTGPGCKKESNSTVVYTTTVLVADTDGYGAARIDPDLANAWGIAIGSTGAFWISANHTGKTPVYDASGMQLLPAVNIPSMGSANGGSPTGVVYSGASGFKGTKFVYANEDGTLSAWTSGTSTVTVADRSAFGAVYKGLAIGADVGTHFLYAANFRNGTIDVFDTGFHYVTNKPFENPTLPAGYAPFNIENIGGRLYVTYALQLPPDNKDDQKGAGHGYVIIYSTSGIILRRFAANGMLNSPWGIAQVPQGFGQNEGDILIGNFGDGHINVYDSIGNFRRPIFDKNGILSVEGLWALTFIKTTVPAGEWNKLYFTAGPDDEAHGTFGYISVQ